MNPRVSVVIPCYNTRPEFLAETLASLEHQTWRDFETIVVDDGSTSPETLAYLAALPPWVRLVRQENRGLPGARNTGFREARGGLVLPLDSDDWLAPEHLAALVAALERTPGAGFAFSHIALEGEASGILQKNYNHFEQLFLNQMPYCILVPRALWQAVGGYDESMRRGYEDWEFNIRLGGRGHRGVVVPKPLFHYRVARSGMLQTMSRRIHGELWGEIQKRNAALYRPGALLRAWWSCSGQPSTYPLWLYFVWLVVYKLLPNRWFTGLFGRLLHLSHSSRAQGGRSASFSSPAA